MDALAQKTDVTAVMPPLTDEQESAVEGLLAQASTTLRGWALERGYILEDVLAGSDLRTEIAKVAVVNAVKRALNNLDGLLETTTTVAIDDYRETNTSRRDSAVSTGQLYIDPLDRAGLLPAKRSKFGTIPLRSAL